MSAMKLQTRAGRGRKKEGGGGEGEREKGAEGGGAKSARVPKYTHTVPIAVSGDPGLYAEKPNF